MSAELIIAVHHVPTPPAGPAIMLATEACMRGPWVMGGEHPATHAFVVVNDSAGMWRLDGRPPDARWRPFNGWDDYGAPVAAWRILAPERAIAAGIRRARELDGTSYDWAEIAAQAISVAGHLPGINVPVLHLARMEWIRQAMICTRVCVEVVRAVGGPLAEAVEAMPDLLPERGAVTMTREVDAQRVA